MTNKTLRDYINLVENAQRESVAEGYTPSAGELARDLTKMPDSDFNKKYGMSKQQANHYYSSSKLKEQGVAEAEKKPHPKTWHDVDPKLGKAVDKMSQAEKVKKGLAHPDTLKKKGVAEDQLEETSPDAIEKIEQLVRK